MLQKELLSNKEGIALLTLFILGSTIILGTGTEAGRDDWLALTLAAVMAAPVFLVYARIIYLYPGKNLYSILDILIGRFAGRIIGLLYIWYAFHLGTLVTVNFSEFMITVGLRHTPRIIPTLILLLLCAWIIKDGLDVIGRWSSLTLPVVVSFIVLTTLLLIPQLNASNLLPILENSSKFLKGAFDSFSFPFAETIIFLLVISRFKSRASSFKIYFWGLLLAGGILLIITVRNMAVLGPDLLDSSYFPSHIVSRRIDVTDFLQRLEILVAVIFVFAGFTKISLCLLAACKGLAYLINMKDYRVVATPMAMLMINFSLIIYKSAMEMVAFVPVYKYYAMPFQVFIPVIILILAEIRTRRRKSRPVKDS